MINNIPDELKEIPRWICHRDKVPKNPNTGRNLAGDQLKWGTTFREACVALAKYRFDGLGFVFVSNDEYCGIDIDHCVKNSVVNDAAKEIIDYCDSYTEYSPSKTGIHIIVKNIDTNKVLHKKNGVEVYTEGRYFTVSGFGITGKDQVNTVNVNKLLKKIIANDEVEAKKKEAEARKEAERKEKEARKNEPETKNDIKESDKPEVTKAEDLPLGSTQIRELVDRIESSANGAKFKILWEGNWKQEYESHSEADMALCSILAFWLVGPVQIDQVFRLSKMFREKWDRSVGQGKTYGQLLIEKVMLHREGSITVNSMVVELDIFREMEMPEIKMIMSPWLSFGSTHMIYAKRGVGKTFFSMSLSLAAVCGSDFGEWELCEPVNTLYVDGEMLPQKMKERVLSLQSNYSGKQKNWYILSSGINLQNNGLAINIAKPYWQDFIYNEVTSKDIKLIFLDNISALTPGIEENESTSWDVIAAWINKLKQTGCAVVLVHHAGKGGQQRGTSAREDALDTVIFLKKTTDDATVGVDVDIIFEKSRHIAGAAVTSVNAKLITEPGTSNLIWNINSAGTSKRNEVVQLLVDGKSIDEVKDILKMAKSTVVKFKNEAKERNWIGESTKNGVFYTSSGKVAMKGEGKSESDYGF